MVYEAGDTSTRKWVMKVIKDALDKIDSYQIGTNEGKAEFLDKELYENFVIVLRAKIRPLAKAYEKSLETK